MRGVHPKPGYEVVWGIWQPPLLTGELRLFQRCPRFLGKVLLLLPLTGRGASLGSALGVGVLSSVWSTPEEGWIEAGEGPGRMERVSDCILRVGLEEGTRQVHSPPTMMMLAPPRRPPGTGLESRLAPGRFGTLPYPVGYSGHSRAACCLSASSGGPAQPSQRVAGKHWLQGVARPCPGAWEAGRDAGRSPGPPAITAQDLGSRGNA